MRIDKESAGEYNINYDERACARVEDRYVWRKPILVGRTDDDGHLHFDEHHCFCPA